jgi:hypothetical protein
VSLDNVGYPGGTEVASDDLRSFGPLAMAFAGFGWIVLWNDADGARGMPVTE